MCNETSTFSPINIGCPQGSIFSVFLFSVYFNDWLDVFRNGGFNYAVDAEIGRSLDKQIELKFYISNAIKWSHENLVIINIAKFKHVHFSPR